LLMRLVICLLFAISISVQSICLSPLYAQEKTDTVQGTKSQDKTENSKSLESEKTEIKFSKDETKFPSPAYLKRAWGDLKELPTKPFHWHAKDWLIAGGVIGASFTAFIADGAIRTHYEQPENRGGFLTSVSDITTHFGDYKFQLPFIGGMWIAGMTTGSNVLQKTAGDAMEASLIAAGMITPALVYISGRNLPGNGENAMRFEPFTPRRYSYPSGHTTEAFAVATVLDQDLREVFGYWHTPLVYAMAIGTAHSRIYDHKHYLSDVILGAGIGWAVGYWISNKPRNKGKRSTFLIPKPGGMVIAHKF
jgi:membrane-associated phospholipid phosphatase